MLTKNSSKVKSAKKSGNSSDQAGESTVLYLIARNKNKEFKSLFNNKATVGSKTGDLIIDVDGISPRHCTFFIQSGVVSVMDHGSKTGTYLNSQKIQSGKVFIINEKDKIKLSDFVITFEQRPLEVEKVEKVKSEVPEVTASMKLESLASIEPLEDENDEITVSRLIPKEDKTETINGRSLKPKITKQKRVLEIKKKERIKPKKKRKPSVGSGSGVLTRLLSHLYDTLIVLILLDLLSPLKDLKSILDVFNPLNNDHFISLYNSFAKVHIDQFLALSSEVNEAVMNSFQIGLVGKVLTTIVIVYLFRCFSAMLFSVSVGEFFAGIRNTGQSLWKRIIYPFRSAIGIALFPFFIFDLPALLGKRTFKEIITKTQLVTRNFILVLIMNTFTLVVLTSVLFTLPMIRGGKLLAPMTLKEEIVRVNTWDYKDPKISKALSYKFDALITSSYLPYLSLTLKNKKKRMNAGLIFLNIENGKMLKIKKLKSVSLLELYQSFVDGNFTSEYTHSEIYGTVKNIAIKNDNFKFKVKDKKKLLLQTTKLIRDSYRLSLSNMLTFMLNNGPFLSGYRSFRESLSALYPDKIQEMVMTNIGNAQGLLTKHGNARSTYYVFLPLESLDTNMYELSGNFHPREYPEVTNSFSWNIQSEAPQKDLDLRYIEDILNGEGDDTQDSHQALFEKYYFVSSMCMKLGYEDSIKLLIKELSQMLNIMNLNKDINKKNIENLSEVLNALINRDKKFFGINEVETVSL